MRCSQPPEGHSRWTLRLLADKIVELDIVSEISHETVRKVLKKTLLLPPSASAICNYKASKMLILSPIWKTF
ncbi:MAG: helix-turn-helix domain-containing protein [Oscillatoria sp. SIO1A7]|nr:helix-turn-helix domain-containing protein [Oscillatoria sp. SIO1A7]